MPSPDQPNVTVEDEVREAVRALAAARIEYAKRFLFNKAAKVGATDKHAEQMTILDTGDEVTVRQAEVKLSMMKLESWNRH